MLLYEKTSNLMHFFDFIHSNFSFQGNARFTIWSIKLLLELRSYRARVSYLLPNQEEWTSVEDDFVIIYSVTQPWVAKDFFIAPKSKLDDGLMWLMLVKRSKLNRWRLLKIMMGFSEAKHLDFDFVDFFPVKSFKLEPLSKGSYITVDGEVIDHSNIKAEIAPKAIQILS